MVLDVHGVHGGRRRAREKLQGVDVVAHFADDPAAALLALGPAVL
jgi:hypothetical protein